MKIKFGEDFDLSNPLFPWIVEHSGKLLTRCVKGSDGMTAYQRIHGRRPPQGFVPLGETVLYKEARPGRPGNREMRFEKGVWLGVRAGGAEVFIGTPNGTKRASEVRRLGDDIFHEK